jgi:uncharacterized repeat protein (TIGR01451 family)
MQGQDRFSTGFGHQRGASNAPRDQDEITFGDIAIKEWKNMLSQYRDKARGITALGVAIFALLTLTLGISRAGNQAASPTREWHTFMGGTSNDRGDGITLDEGGRVYVVGSSYATWGSPVNAYAGEQDAFVAQLTSDGSRQWNTFLGSASGIDDGNDIVTDETGDIYVVGTSGVAWGSPLSPFGGRVDAFVAKLDSDGALLWMTFLGGSGADSGRGIAVDGGGDVYVVGTAGGTWGSPVDPYPGGWYAPFVAKLDSEGALQWHTYWGAGGLETGEGIAVDGDGDVYVVGICYETWGSPVDPYIDGTEACVAKLDANGARQWNTFLGSANSDGGLAIAVDESGDVYVTGYSYATWGDPINPHDGSHYDVFIAGLRSDDGVRRWNTFASFMGTSYGEAITVDWTNNLFVAGKSKGDGVFNRAFLMKLDADGVRGWNTFMGATYDHDVNEGVASDGRGHVYVTGHSLQSWGLPINAYAGERDGFVARLALPAQTDLAIHKSVQPCIASPGDPITYTLAFSNKGYLTATGVLISDVMPSSLINLGYTTTGATIVPTGVLSYVWETQDLAPRDGGIITITGFVSPSLSIGTVLVNTAMITSPIVEGNPSDNHSSARVLIPSSWLFLPTVVRDH